MRVSPGATLPREPGGAKPPLVLAHGAVISGNYFVHIAPMLARWFDVYAPDLPGQGKSDKPARAPTVPEAAEMMRAWLDAAGIERASMIGHSLGCQVLAHVAADRPERIDRLVLMGPTVAPSQRNAWSVLWRLAIDALRERKSLVLLEALDLARIGVRRAWQVMRAAFADRIEETLPRVPHPTLLVRGSRDLLAPREWMERLVRLAPNGSLVELEGSPHAMHFTDAERTIAPIIAFLRPSLPLPEREAGAVAGGAVVPSSG